MSSIKCVVTGDGAVGKTCLLLSYAQNKFPTDYVPTVFNNYVKNLLVNGQPVKLGLWDTAGQEDYDRLRVLSYQKAEIIIICFALDNPISLSNIRNKWVPEAIKRCPGAPYIIVGTKLDIRNTKGNAGNSENSFITKEQGAATARDLGARAYVESSALTQEGLKAVFDVAVRVALLKQGSECCCTIS